jgi:hypothetical protein
MKVYQLIELKKCHHEHIQSSVVAPHVTMSLQILMLICHHVTSNTYVDMPTAPAVILRTHNPRFKEE